MMRLFSPHSEERYADIENWLGSALPRSVSLPPVARQRIWQQAQQAAVKFSPQPQQIFWKLAAPFFTFLLLLGFSSGYVGIVFASGASVPGDSLYTFERQIESLWMKLTPSTQRSEVRLVLLERRIYEVRALLDSGRNVPENLFQEKEMLFLSLKDEPFAHAGPQLQHDRDVLQLLDAGHPGIYALQKALDAAEVAITAMDSP